jgi:hypothetical protein
VGEAIGVRCKNRFQVLSRGGVRGETEGGGEVGVKGGRKVRVV